MVWALRGRGRVEPHLPKNWNVTQRTIISADADVVDLVGLFILVLYQIVTPVQVLVWYLRYLPFSSIKLVLISTSPAVI